MRRRSASSAGSPAKRAGARGLPPTARGLLPKPGRLERGLPTEEHVHPRHQAGLKFGDVRDGLLHLSAAVLDPATLMQKCERTTVTEINHLLHVHSIFLEVLPPGCGELAEPLVTRVDRLLQPLRRRVPGELRV